MFQCEELHVKLKLLRLLSFFLKSLLFHSSFLDFRKKEQALFCKKLVEGNGIPKMTREDVMNCMNESWKDINVDQPLAFKT